MVREKTVPLATFIQMSRGHDCATTPRALSTVLVAWRADGWHHRYVHAAFIWLRGSAE